MNDLYKIAISRFAVDHKLPSGSPDWPAFNAGFENMELPINKLAGAVYQGRCITTWHKDHWRTGANYLCGQHLGLDFDQGDATFEYLKKNKFIAKYAAILYTTMSHCPDCPKARVIFVMDKPIMQSRNYSLAAQSLLWLFGTADKHCKDAVRFFYGAPGCQVELLNNVLPLETVKKMIADYQETGHREQRKATRPDYLPPPSQQEVNEALKFIPPWQVDYDEWVSILMSIHSEFGEGGYELAEHWADGKQGEIDQKWKSFHKGGNTAGAITIATVFGIAKRFGWRKQHEIN